MTATRRVLTVPILMYHYISTPPDRADKYRLDLSVTPDRFEAQLRYLKEHGFTSVTLFDLYNHLNTGAPLPPKPVVLTFDDGHRDAYEYAFPLLRRYGLHGTFFIISDLAHVSHPAYLTWDMIAEMAAAGMRIESHSRSHPDLRQRSYDELVWQILGPIEGIQAYTGWRSHFFCYPSGRYDDDAIAVLKSADVWAAVTTESGRRQTLANAMTWPRLRVHGGTSLADFAGLVE
jgi:peptidoglycan/xylan/chitin deacetylase (PgdA/CDA1 family)